MSPAGIGTVHMLEMVFVGPNLHEPVSSGPLQIECRTCGSLRSRSMSRTRRAPHLAYPQSAHQEPQPDAQPGARRHGPG